MANAPENMKSAENKVFPDFLNFTLLHLLNLPFAADRREGENGRLFKIALCGGSRIRHTSLAVFPGEEDRPLLSRGAPMNYRAPERPAFLEPGTISPIGYRAGS
jgi:hypothetical protein